MNADAKGKAVVSLAAARGRRWQGERELDHVASSSSSGGRPRKKARKSGSEHRDQHRDQHGSNDGKEDNRKMALSNNDNANTNESEGDETLPPSPPLSQSERKLHRERRRRNDLHLSFRRLINTLSKYHPEVSCRPATDDVNSAEGSRPGLHQSFSERLARAVESGGGARAVLGAATDTTKLNRIDIIDCTVETLEELLSDKETSSAKMAQMSEQLAKKDQEIATLQMRLQQSQQLAAGSHGQAANGARVAADAVAPGPNHHPLPSLQMRLQEAAATVQQAIGSHNQASNGTGIMNNAAIPRLNHHGHAIANSIGLLALPAAGLVNNVALPATSHANNTALPTNGHVNNTVLPASSLLHVPPIIRNDATRAQLMLNPAMPGVGTLVINPSANAAPAVVSRAAGMPEINPTVGADISVPLGNSNNGNANAVLAAASLMAGASRNSNSNSSNTSVLLGQIIQNGSHQGPSVGAVPNGAPFL